MSNKDINLKNIPYTNGVDSKIQGHVDLTTLVDEAFSQAEKEIQELKDKGEW